MGKYYIDSKDLFETKLAEFLAENEYHKSRRRAFRRKFCKGYSEKENFCKCWRLEIRTYAPIFQKQNSLFVPFVCLFRFNTFRFDAVGVYGITSPRL